MILGRKLLSPLAHLPRWVVSGFLGAFILLAITLSADASGGAIRAGSPSLREKGRRLAERFSKETRSQVDMRERGSISQADARPKQVGDEESFQLDKIDSGTRSPVPAILRAIGVHCYVYVEKGQQLDDGKVKQVVEAFDNRVFPVDTQWFGSEWSPGIDGDPRITLLLVDGLKDMDGFFDPEDEYTKEKCPTSNEREMVVLAISRLESFDDFVSDLLAHEFQHMIHWNNDPREATWVDEACSGYAAVLFKQVPFTVEYFLKAPDRCLIDWDDTVEWSNYGHVFLFTNYLFRNAASTDEIRRRMMRTLVKSRKTSVSGFEEALAQGDIPISFAEVFRSFCAATHLNRSPEADDGSLGFDPFVAGKVGGMENNPLKPARSFRGSTGKAKAKVKMWSSLAFRFHLGQRQEALKVGFRGTTFDAKKGKNSFDVGVAFYHSSGEMSPRISWLKLSGNEGEGTVAIPDGFDLGKVIVVNRGPGQLPANEKRWPPVPFTLEIGQGDPAATEQGRFEALHSRP